MTTRHTALAPMLVLSTTLLSAQSATTSAPSAYRTQFENEYVHLIRVHYGPNVKLPVHEHPTVVTVYVYLNASGPVEFRHVEDNRLATRRPTVAGSFRVSGGADEHHAVVNTTPTPSDFLRIEFKTDPAGASSPFAREVMRSYPAGENATDVKFANKQMRITRLVVAPGKTLDQTTSASEPALIVATKDATLAGLRQGNATAVAAGQERWLDAGQTMRLVNSGSAPAELLRIDFLTGPKK